MAQSLIALFVGYCIAINLFLKTLGLGSTAKRNFWTGISFLHIICSCSIGYLIILRWSFWEPPCSRLLSVFIDVLSFRKNCKWSVRIVICGLFFMAEWFQSLLTRDRFVVRNLKHSALHYVKYLSRRCSLLWTGCWTQFDEWMIWLFSAVCCMTYPSYRLSSTVAEVLKGDYLLQQIMNIGEHYLSKLT